MSTDLMQALMGLNTGVPTPQGNPLQPQENPMAALQQLGSQAIPASTPAPQAAANAVQQATSLEEILFGMGGTNYGG
jgi:hypothetical protein